MEPNSGSAPQSSPNLGRDIDAAAMHNDPAYETKGRYLFYVFTALFAGWLVSYYILPHTIWGNTSPMNAIADRIQTLTADLPQYGSILLGLMAVCALYTFRNQIWSHSSFSPSGLWLLVGV